jgi:hypothetical protein
MADVRYQFRISVAPIPLRAITFGVVACVGTLTLLTDLWRAEQWLVPRGDVLTPGSWQALLGGVFLATFLVWAWVAFIRPPIFGRLNARRFANTLYRYIHRGSPAELAVIADELTRSAKTLIHHAIDYGPRRGMKAHQGTKDKRPSAVQMHAGKLLHLIGDRRLCRVIVESSPATALAFFLAMEDAEKYGVDLRIFAENIVAEAVANKDSFLFHEANEYHFGQLGWEKSLSESMFSNYRMVEAIGTVFDAGDLHSSDWDGDQWKAYSRALLLTFQSYAAESSTYKSAVLHRAMRAIGRCARDLRKLNGVDNPSWHKDDLVKRLSVAVDFVSNAVSILDERGVPDHIRLRLPKKDRLGSESIYDDLAKMIVELILIAGSVRSPRSSSWFIQQNMVWSELFSLKLNSAAGRIVQFKVRRLLYDELPEMQKFPNYKGSRILGLCLNVMGFKIMSGGFGKEGRALQKAVLSWTRQHFARIHAINPRIVEVGLVDGMTYEPENLRLVVTYSADALWPEAQSEHFQVDPAPAVVK